MVMEEHAHLTQCNDVNQETAGIQSVSDWRLFNWNRSPKGQWVEARGPFPTIGAAPPTAIGWDP